MLKSAFVVLSLGLLSCAACTTMGTAVDDAEPVIVAESAPQEAPETPEAADSPEEEGEVPLAVAESETRESSVPADELAEVVVLAPARHEVIHNLVAEAQALLRDVQLQYVFTGSGKREVLRGRPVAFALWSESTSKWTIAHIEIPRPPVKWKPGGKPMPFTVRTPGIQARHVKGTGAERLMFTFSRGDDQLKVYGRKYPVFDSALLKKKQWRAVASTAQPIVYLPFTEDTFDPLFVSNGKEFLLSTANRAIRELREAAVPSAAFPGALLADVVPPQVITTLAVIEQTDDGDYIRKQDEAVNEVLSQYGLKREEAYRYSVSKASAIGPMQFTNKRGKGTLLTGSQALSGGQAGSKLRARRDQPAQRHEGRHLPHGHRVVADAQRHTGRLPQQSDSAWHLSGGRIQRRTAQCEPTLRGDEQDGSQA